MKTIELLKNTNVSFFGNVKYNRPYKTITLLDWYLKYSVYYKNMIDKIRLQYDINKKIAKKMKSDYLPCVTISAVFDSYRRIDLAKTINPVLAIDIDYDDNPHIEDWDHLKETVSELPFVFLTSYSCSGKGLYCLVYFDTNKDLNKIFNALQDDFKQLGIIIDKNCRDITRLRFVSWDDKILIKPEDIDIDIYNKEMDLVPVQKIIMNNEYTYGSKYINETEFIQKHQTINETDDFIYSAVYHLITQCNYRANDYHTWLQDGFRLATFGEYGFILFMLLSMNSDNYDEHAAKQKFLECKKTTRYDKSSLIYYFSLLKNHYGKDWRRLINKL